MASVAASYLPLISDYCPSESQCNSNHLDTISAQSDLSLSPRSLSIVFLGSINHLYADGLNDLLSILYTLSSSSNITLTFVSPSPSFSSLNISESIPSFVKHVACSDDQLLSLISCTDISFLPYSFSAISKKMVETSFPSKLLSYLSHSKFILCYSPPYSTSSCILSKYKHPICGLLSPLSQKLTHFLILITCQTIVLHMKK